MCKVLSETVKTNDNNVNALQNDIVIMITFLNHSNHDVEAMVGRMYIIKS